MWCVWGGRLSCWAGSSRVVPGESGNQRLHCATACYCHCPHSQHCATVCYCHCPHSQHYATACYCQYARPQSPHYAAQHALGGSGSYSGYPESGIWSEDVVGVGGALPQIDEGRGSPGGGQAQPPAALDGFHAAARRGGGVRVGCSRGQV